MRYFCVFVLVVLAACLSISNGQSNNITWGHIGPNDVLIHQQYLTKKAKKLLVVSEDVRYPPKGIPGNRIITGIRLTDQYKNGKGGYGSLKDGGPGYKDVTIHCKSQRSHGYKFILEIYVR